MLIGASFLGILVAGAGHAAQEAAAGLSPAEFRLALPRSREFLDIDLPRFHRATSIELRGHCLRLTLPPRPAGFPALQRLSLSGCRVDLADLTPLCPRLRVLAVAEGLLDSNITVKSGSLEELAAANLSRWTGRIDVDAPMLKKLALSFSIDGELGVSIVAPIVDKVSWECSYSRLTVGLDPWSLSSVSLHAAAEVPGEDDGARLQQHSNVLSLHMWACICLMS
ncbi:uncharacterized protein [Triticum aestivum]|uniref:uncharacterized protein isoform X1 n=1 Tax=Triticum aestivum TaxID=4565 RepID=UPI001D002CF8|nr:uncharacterized protein LOC123102035 isoform X1 [Triticum aestivum]